VVTHRFDVLSLTFTDEEPHKVLRINGLPPNATSEALTALFRQFVGFKEVRLVPGLDIAFVEYETEPQAVTARMTLGGAQLTDTHVLNITYAKK
jgi:RNA recognition motif-containing protein